MSFSDWTADLARSFRRTNELLQQLLSGLQARRSAWISARSSVLTPSTELESLTQSVAAEENTRTELLARIRVVLPTPVASDASQLHVNVTRIAAAMPAVEARSLREVADEARRLAKAVRGEVTLGQRLLQFSQRAQLAAVGGEAPSARSGYDRRARSVRGGAAGALVDGRI
jgi:hypothetical protein